MTPHWYPPNAPELEGVSIIFNFIIVGEHSFCGYVLNDFYIWLTAFHGYSHYFLLQCNRFFSYCCCQVRCRGLPDDFDGDEVRVVEIEGLDSNMCCGTHVSSLCHLQVGCD